MNLKTWQERIFNLLLLLLPANLAKHFVFPSAYVSGVLVDYLIPTVYLTDLLIICLLFLWILEKTKKTFLRALVIFLVLLLPSLFAAKLLVPAVYKWLKLLELVGLAAWIKAKVNWHLQLPRISFYLSLSILWQSLLSFLQWFKQGSVGGYLLLGQQPYNAATPGLDKITWWDGSLKLPPLGTTTHPNVLAGLVAVILPLTLSRLFSLLRESKRQLNFIGFYLLTTILALITLSLTFSLAAWIAVVLIVIPFGLRRIFNQKPVVLLGYLILVFSLVIGFWPHLTFLAPQSSFSRRSQLASMALKMIKNSPLIGVGLNNFTVVMDQYGFITATTRFLQPVHNIFLLIAAETGLLGLVGFIYLLIQAFKKWKPPVVKLSLFVLLFLGLFDHYPSTLQPTLILFFLLI